MALNEKVKYQEYLKQQNQKLPVLQAQNNNVVKPVSMNRNPIDSMSDAEVISKYESIPNYNIFERVFDLGKKETQYEQKQALSEKYNAAKERQISDALGEYNNNGDLIPYLNSRGITEKQYEDYNALQKARTAVEGAERYAQDHPALATLSAVPYGLYGGVQTGISEIGNYLTGKPIGSNAALNERAKLASTMTGTVKQGIQDNAKTEAGKVLGGLAYDAAASSVDYLTNLGLTGFNPVAALALMGYKSAANSLNDQKGKNTTADQKMATAAINGAIEVLTEKIPMDDLFKLAKTPTGKQAIKQLLFGVGKQAAEEGVEEFVNEIASNIADFGINGGESDYAQTVSNYMAQGMDEGQARNMARMDVLERAGYAGAAGALSGGVMGGSVALPGMVNNIANYGRNSAIDAARMEQLPVLQQNVEQNVAEKAQANGIPNLGDRFMRLRDENYEIPQQESLADRVMRLRNDNFELNQQNNNTIPAVQTENNAPKKTYDSKNVSGMDEFNKQAKYFSGTYGTPEIKETLYPQFVQTVNEFMDTGDFNAFVQATELAEQLDKAMEGRTYTSKGSKNGKKPGTITTYPSGSMSDLMADFYEDFNNVFLQKNGKTTAVNTQNTAINTPNSANDLPILQDNSQNQTVKSKNKEPNAEIRLENLKNEVTAEDIGLNEPESIVAEFDVEPPAGQDGWSRRYDGNENVSKFATNTMGNNLPEMQTPEAQAILQNEIEQGNFDKGKNSTHNMDTMENSWTREKARELIKNNADELEQRILSGNIGTDPVLFEAALQMQSDAFPTDPDGDLTKWRKLAMRNQGTTTDIARMMQLLASRSDRDVTSAVQKTEVLIDQANEKYFKKGNNKKKREGCLKLATALKNIGNDYTQVKAPKEQTFGEVRKGVLAELERESGSVLKRFNDTDVDYLTNLVMNGYTAKDIQTRLEHKITTGKWEISDSDIRKVNDLLKEADKYDNKSKQAAELDAQACKILAEYLPEGSLREKWNAWRYLAMLGNPRTHIRNIADNLFFGQVLENATDKMAATLETVLPVSERTKSLKVAPKEMRDAAGKYLEEKSWTDLTEGGNKHTAIDKRSVEGQKKVFGNKNIFAKVLQKASDFSSDLLTKEDTTALVRKYKQAMANYLVANGKDASVFDSKNPADVELLEKANEYAIRRAKEATFHEESKFANGWNKVSKDWHKEGGALSVAAYAMDELMPFVKTPANVLKMSGRYSPAGILNALYHASKGDVTKTLEDISRSLTGSALLVLGMYLRSKGVLRARGKEEEKQLDKVTGQQDYSININGESYTMDWLSPAVVPLFMGAEIYKQLVEEKEVDVGHIISAIAEPVTEMSMLQGINNTINSIAKNRNSDSPVGEVLADIGFGYVSQGIPSIMGQVSRSVDDTRRNTYYTGKKSGSTDDMLEQNGKKITNKIPVLSKVLEPYVNAWGEEEKNYGNNVGERLFWNMLSPGYRSKSSIDDTEKELYRLNKETNGAAKNVLPALAKTTPVNGMEKLTPQEYTEWAKVYGQTEKKFYDATTKNSRYAKLDNAGKNEMLNDVRLFANAMALEEFDNKYYKTRGGLDIGQSIEDKNAYKKQYQAYEYKGEDGLIDYITINNLVKDEKEKAKHNSITKADRINALDSITDMSTEDKYNYLKIMDDYTKKGQYVDRFLSQKYAYDWYRIEALSGGTKDDKTYAIITSDLPEIEKQALLEVNNMSNDTITYHLVTGE